MPTCELEIETDEYLEPDVTDELYSEPEVIKPRTRGKRRNKKELFELIQNYGIKAPETYECIKVFYESQLRKYLLVEFDDSLVPECHLRVMRAVEGYYKEEKGKKVWVEPYFDPEKCKDPINFIITICKYVAWGHNYHHGKRNVELDRNERLDDLTCHSAIDNLDYFRFNLKHIKFEGSFSEHLSDIFRCSPSNNVFLNLVKWDLS